MAGDKPMAASELWRRLIGYFTIPPDEPDLVAGIARIVASHLIVMARDARFGGIGGED